MNIHTAHTLYKELINDKHVFAFQGNFHKDLVDNIIRVSQSNIQDIPTFKRKVPFLMVECFQNILRHADKPNIIHATNNKPEMFFARNLNNKFLIGSSNLIKKEKIESLKDKLENINDLSPEDLKTLRTTTLQENELSEKGGAGIGLIEMARKTKQALKYDFEFINFYFSLFHVFIQLSNKKELEDDNTLEISDIQRLYNVMDEEKILLLYKDEICQETIIPIIDLLENSLSNQNEKLFVKKKIFYLLVELLQNIIKHGEMGHQGIFLLCKYSDRYVLSTGNLVKNEDAESLSLKLDQINSQTQDELAETYKKNILEKSITKETKIGLGLIDIARYSEGVLEYDIKKIDKEYSFFTLNVSIS